MLKLGQRHVPAVGGHVGGEHQIGNGTEGLGEGDVDGGIGVVGEDDVEDDDFGGGGGDGGEPLSEGAADAANAERGESSLVDGKDGGLEGPRLGAVETEHEIVGGAVERGTELSGAPEGDGQGHGEQAGIHQRAFPGGFGGHQFQYRERAA